MKTTLPPECHIHFPLESIYATHDFIAMHLFLWSVVYTCKATSQQQLYIMKVKHTHSDISENHIHDNGPIGPIRGMHTDFQIS